ncbi:MAG TPA: glycoside hydrolase family 25 protein [Enterococcus aquimarinus]|nr:glycoside hydrolase family 25 protein [Enterococcus aquimarinus]
MNPKPIILDISEWQVPSQIHYDVLSRQIGGVIVRIQYGSNYEDQHYRTHLAAFQKYNVPVAVYAWVRGTSITDMEKEASDFYRRAKAFQPSFWWLDVEEQSMTDMRSGVEAYRKKLKSLGAKKVGAYIANHLYRQFNIDTKKFDAIWLPTYGQNTGIYQGNNPTATNEYHLHQYTDQGRLAGYSGKLDLNRIAKGKITDYFEGSTSPLAPVPPTQKEQTYQLLFDVHLRKEPSTKRRFASKICIIMKVICGANKKEQMDQPLTSHSECYRNMSVRLSEFNKTPILGVFCCFQAQIQDKKLELPSNLLPQIV